MKEDGNIFVACIEMRTHNLGYEKNMLCVM